MRHITTVVAGHRFILTYAVAKLTFPILDGTIRPTLRLTMHIKSSMKRRTVGYVLEVFYTDMRNEPFTESQIRELRHGYHACVSYIDSLIGRLIAELDRLGLRENTVIVLWGDHGYHLGEQDCWGKLTTFELAARVPLIVSAPGKKAVGAKSSGLVELVDVYPSLCELADLPLPPNLEGTSFVPLLTAPNSPWKDAAFTQVVHGHATGRSIRTERYRFTRWHQNSSKAETITTELYDLRKAPIEEDNIASRPESAALVNKLAARLEAGWPAAKTKTADSFRD